MKIRDKAGNVLNAIITYESIAASYMRPAFIVDGRAYSPAEAKEAGLIAVSVRHGEWTKLKQGGYDLPDETPEAIAGARGAHKAQVGVTSMLVWGALRASTEPLSEEAIIKIFDDIPADVVRDALTLLVTEHKAQPLGGAVYEAKLHPRDNPEQPEGKDTKQ